MNRSRLLTPLVGASLVIAAVTGCSSPAPAAPSPSPSETAAPVESASASEAIGGPLAELEDELQVRIGVSAVHIATGERLEYRPDERFGYASTLKLFAAAAMLRTVPEAERAERVMWTQEEVDAAGYAPVAQANVATGLTVAELAEAAVRDSDNEALNLVIERIGGVEALGADMERLGDTTSHIVNDEPELNEVAPGETDDTSTPAAFTAALTEIVDGDALSDDDRAILLDWASGNVTGDKLIRAGAPEGWVVADKSGGAGPIRNDIAVVTPPSGGPIIVTVFTTKDDPAAKYDDAAVSRAAAIVLTAFSERP